MADFEDDALPGSPEVDAYVSSLVLEDMDSLHTARAYESDLKDFLRWARRQDVDPLDLTTRQARRYLGELDAAGYERATINRRLSALKGFYRWLRTRGITQGDPVSALQGPKKPRRLPRPVTPAEMERLLAVHAPSAADDTQERSPADMRDQAVLELMYACGLRISEVSDLLLVNVDLQSLSVKVMGKGSKERIVPMHPIACKALKSYLEKGRPELLDEKRSEFVFVSSRGNRYSPDAIRRMFKRTLAEAGLDPTLSPHAIRHAFATDILGGGADLRSIQELLGHASLSTTQVYTHVTSERISEVHRQAHPRG